MIKQEIGMMSILFVTGGFILGRTDNWYFLLSLVPLGYGYYKFKQIIEEYDTK